MYLCPDMIKDGQQYRVEHARPEGRCEGRAMVLQRVK